MSSPRVGGTALILGGILALVGNVLHPRGEAGSPESLAQLITANLPSPWYPAHALLMAGLPIQLLGFLTLYQALAQKDERTYALPALLALTLGTLLLFIAVLLDGFLEPLLAQTYLAASGGASAAASAVLQYSSLVVLTLLAPAFLAFWLGGGLMSAALIHAKLFSRGFAWVGVVLGVIGILGYVAGVFGPYWVLSAAFVPYSLAFTLWLIVLGVFLYRGR